MGRKIEIRQRLKLVFSIAMILVLCACSSTTTTLPPSAEADNVYKISSRQLPPEPVYNRLRWVHLPDVVPARNVERVDAPMLKPIYEFDVKNVPLNHAVKILASTARYDSYCAPSISDQKITLKRLGTIDELAEAIEQQSGIRVVVDHDTREVRFLAHGGEQARLFNK